MDGRLVLKYISSVALLFLFVSCSSARNEQNIGTKILSLRANPFYSSSPADTGDGGTIPGPSPSPGGGDGGFVPVKVQSGFERDCAPHAFNNQPDFIFYEEAQNPLLTVETIYTVTDPGAKKQVRKTLVLWKTDMRGVSFLQNPKPTIPMVLDLTPLIALFPDTWRKHTLSAFVCEDKKQTGTCSDKTGYALLSRRKVAFQSDAIPQGITFQVWSGRGMSKRKNPQFCDVQVDPLVLDLSGGGIKLTGPETKVLFDLADDGKPSRTGWLASTDEAFLVRDLNRNGIIDSGAELFGTATRLPNGKLADNGFEALKALDSNKDGVFDAKDEAWPEVQLWIDRNINGVTEPGELVSLEDAGITSIDLNYLSMDDMDQFGNLTKQRSTFTRRVNGMNTQQMIIDVWFNTEFAY